ncbi:Na(+)/H(+) antiporter subunit D [Gimibacter soli]|uniref:Na(+)/H(+) antiporter subunit D n=1 Tax=Gimibacter soli TaxID=3024400 RepID=A0AAE9XVD3_9PROT|nr:Na(+)/H(+) antiporter subunit D [Gimibacter soli]WCL54498.1 Na(+)/H(+) antiporter subunit D [Gimibacter soli]
MTADLLAYPPLLLLIGAAVIALAPRPVGVAAIFLAPLAALWAVWTAPEGVMLSAPYLDLTLEVMEVSPVRRLFAIVFTLMTLVGGLFAFRQAARTELAAAFAYAGSALGICFAGDLLTLFLFWEMLAIFSTIVIWSGGTEKSRAAGQRYAVLHLLGGLVLMAGILGLWSNTGSLDIRVLTDQLGTLSGWLVLGGVLINVAAPPLSAWLADAYPEASATGTVFLSAYTTKAAVLVLILLFPGATILIGVGLYMVFYGIIYALLENDARRILAYSIVNQVGFMVTAVGIGTEVALNGAAAHAFAHIIYKALLLMSAGVVLYRTGRSKCTDLGGLFQTMPVTAICGIIGALAISSFPFTSGFTTKTMISEAAHMEGLVAVYFLLAAASAGVFLHAGIKFPWFVFFQKDSGLRPKDAPWNMAAAMIFFAVLCVFFGLYPDPLYALLPYPVEFEAYKAAKLVFYFQLLLFSGLAFFLLLPWMKRTETVSLDTDWLYRVALHGLARRVMAGVAGAASAVATSASGVARQVMAVAERVASGSGALARSWSVAGSALIVSAMLSLYILAYYLTA